MTKSELEARIRSYLHRDDLDSATLDGIIDQAMVRIGHDFKPTIAESTAPWNQSAPDLPSDYGAMRYVFQDRGTHSVELKPMSPMEAQEWSAPAAQQFSIGYVISGSQMTLYPASDRECTLVYWARPAPLTDPGASNYATENYPVLSLYACLIEGAIWEQNTEMANTYATHYANALETARIDDERVRWGDAPVASSHYQTRSRLSRGM